MTVAELIALLEGYPSECEVIIYDGYGRREMDGQDLRYNRMDRELVIG